MMKTAPGSRITQYAPDGSVVSEKYIGLPRRDRAAGVTDTTDYRLSKQGYFDHLVTLLQGWSSHPEVVAGRWPSTVEAALGIAPQYAYPLSSEDATALANSFIDVYAPSRSARNVLRNFEGFILDGPEYLTVFAGATGKELQTIDYKPGRGDDGLLWGDYAMSRIEPATASTASSPVSRTSTGRRRRRSSPAATTRAPRSSRTTGTARSSRSAGTSTRVTSR